MSNKVSIDTCRDTSGRGNRTCKCTTYAQRRSESIHRTSFHRTSLFSTNVHCTTVTDVAADNNTPDRLTIEDGCTCKANVLSLK